MKVLDVFIVKGESSTSAIGKAMGESPKRRTMTEISGSIVVTGDIGLCECVTESDEGMATIKNYFFASPLSDGFYRVDYCVETSFSPS